MKQLLVLGFLFFTSFAAAQFTTVTGTVTDPNGLPYAFATISPLLVLPGNVSPTLNGQTYLPPTAATGMDITGHFTMRLADTSILLPGGTKWNFTVCSAGGTVQPSIGKGAVCFTLAAPITISGSSQDISANLNAVALALTLNAGGCAIGTCIVNNPNADQTITGTGSPRPRLIISGNSYNTTFTEDSASPTDAIETHTGIAAGLSLFTHSSTSTGIPSVSLKRSRGTQGSPNAILNGDFIASMNIFGYDGTGYFQGADITMAASENWGPANHGTYMVLDFTPIGTINNLVHALSLGTQCINNASPAVCGGNSYGVIAVPTGTTPTLLIQTSQVNGTSRIFLEIDASATIPSTTCNTTLAQLVQPIVTARAPGTSFTIQINATVTVNPVCVSYWLVN